MRGCFCALSSVYMTAFEFTHGSMFSGSSGYFGEKGGSETGGSNSVSHSRECDAFLFLIKTLGYIFCSIYHYD